GSLLSRVRHRDLRCFSRRPRIPGAGRALMDERWRRDRHRVGKTAGFAQQTPAFRERSVLMRRLIPRSTHILLLLTAAVSLPLVAPASAAVLHYRTVLSGANEAPLPNASPGTGVAEITIDDVANTMRVQLTFSGLLGNTTACHIHGPTASPGSGTASVATMTPYFTGFPPGVTSGTLDHTFDLTLTASYNGPFVTANGGTAAGAEAALLSMIAAGKAYFNVHSTSFPGGEERGFLGAFDPTPTLSTTWGRIKSIYR